MEEKVKCLWACNCAKPVYFGDDKSYNCTLVWNDLIYALHCVSPKESRLQEVLGLSWLSDGTFAYAAIHFYVVYPQLGHFISEGTGWKHRDPPHLFQRHPLHLLLHVTAFLSFLFLQQTGWSLMLRKTLAKQLVYRQHQLMCDPKSWSDSAVLGKNKQGRRQVGVWSIRTLPFGSCGWRSNKLGTGSGGEAINLQGFLETALLCLLSSFVFSIPLSRCLI